MTTSLLSVSGARPRPTARTARRRAAAGAAVRRGIPRPRSVSSIARQRTRGPNTPWPAALAQARSAAVSSAWMGWPGTLWWISTFGSRSARSDGLLDGERVARQRQAHRAVGVQQHPAAAPAEFVAGAVDDQTARARVGPHHRPRVGHRVDVVLAQHVERPHQHRLQSGQFETAEGEFDVGRRHGRCGAGGVDPLGVDLQADDPHVGPHRAQPRGQFQRRHRQRAVAEVDDQRIGGR